MALTHRQQRFVEEFVLDLNATRAAVRAGFSERTAAEQRCQLLSKPHVAEAIAEAKKARSGRTGVTADRVVEEIARVAFANIGDVVTWGDAVAVTSTDTGEVTIAQGIALVASEKLPQHIRAAISEVRQTREGLALKMHSKVEALDKLMRHLGEYAPDKHEHSGKNGAPIKAEFTNLDRAKGLAALMAKIQSEAKEKSG